MPELDHIAVVGGSLGGLRTLEALRREGYTGRLTLVGEEQHFPPYDRPPLSKEVLLGTWEPERARLRVAEDLDVEFLLGRRAVAVDLGARLLSLEDGSTVSFEGLVIATGAAPRMLPFVSPKLRGVHVLRTLEESLALRASLERGGEVVVIGAGWIGAEVAAACRARDLHVTVLEALEAPMIRSLGPVLGMWAAELHRSHGVDVRLGTGVSGIIEDDGAIRAVVLADGSEIRADVLVVAVGVAPSTGWLEHSGLRLEDGVVCDATGHAIGADDVVAVGDVARWRNMLFDRDLRVEHWTNAVEQADFAARSLLLGPEHSPLFSSVPFFWSDQYDKKIQYVGTAGEFAEVTEGGLDEERFVATFTFEGQLVGALCVNAPGRMIRYKRLIAEHVGPEAVASILPTPN